MASSWTAGANLNTARRFLTGGGVPASAICMGGSTIGTDSVANVEECNGVAWSNIASLSVGRRLLSGGGTPLNAITMGGYASASSNVTEEFAGVSWASGGNLPAAKHGQGGDGNADSAVAVGDATDSTLSYIYNGAVWSTQGALNGARMYGTAVGSSASALVAGGQHSTSNLKTTELFNGTAWSATGNLPTAKRLMSRAGGSSAALMAGGYTTTYINVTEKFTTSSWATDSATLNTARYGLTGGGTTSSAICMGGVISSSSAVSEIYSDGTSAVVVRGAASSRNASSGRLPRLNLQKWNLTELTIPTYDSSGEAVHPSVVYIPGGWGGHKYFMAMTPYPSGNDDYENPSLLASNDGETWVVPTGITNPLEPMPAGSHNCDPCLVWDGDNEILYMYYNRSSATKRIPITQSEGTFSAGTQDTLTLPETAMSIAVKRNGATDWICWYRSVAYSGPSKIFRCNSTDGIVFSSAVEIPIVSMTTGLKLNVPEIWHQSIYELEDGRNLVIMAMYPNGIASGGYTDLYWGLMRDDYREIELYPTVLIASIPTWGTGVIYLSSLMKLENGMYRLFISASTTAMHWSIGYADISLS